MDCGTELREKRIIIFGASRGIGLQIASHLISKYSDVMISSGNQANLDTAHAALKREFPAASKLAKLQADLARPEMLEGALSPVLQAGNPFDTVIISAAVLGPSGDFASTDFADWVTPFQVNLFGPVKVVQFFLKNNLIRKNGRIIFLSGGISTPDPYFVSFSSTKHALNGFAYSLAHQLAEKDIWINSVLPGSYHTRMNEIRIARGPENIGEANYALALSRIDEDDAAKYQKLNNLMAWLCSPSADGVYGRLISAQHDDWANNISRLKNAQDDLYKIIRTKD